MAGLFTMLFGGADSGSPAAADSIVIGRDPHDDFFYQPIGGGPSFTGRRVSEESAMNISAVYTCIGLIAKMTALAPLRMYRWGDPSKSSEAGKFFEAPEHPINELLERRPNDWQSAWEFKAFMAVNLALRGNAYAEIIPGRRGFVDSLEPIAADLVQVERLPDRSIRYHVTDEGGGNKRVLLAREVLHLRSWRTIRNGLVGIGPISHAKQTLGLSLATEEHGARIFSNGARPQGIVEVPKEMGEVAYRRFKAEWNAANSGLNGAGRTPILEDGATFRPISMNADETQFLQTRSFQIEEICRWLDTPPIMLHHTANTTAWGTGVESVMRAYVRQTLLPWFSCWTNAISRSLILRPEIYEARFDTDQLQQGDSKALADFYSRLVLNGILLRNEARTALGYNPVEGLDEPLVPSNTTTNDAMPGNGGDTRNPDSGGAGSGA